MNIHTATAYAQQGYYIYRRCWLDPEDGHIIPPVSCTIYIERDGNNNMSFMYEKDNYYILTPEDCLADDWGICTK